MHDTVAARDIPDPGDTRRGARRVTRLTHATPMTITPRMTGLTTAPTPALLGSAPRLTQATIATLSTRLPPRTLFARTASSLSKTSRHKPKHLVTKASIATGKPQRRRYSALDKRVETGRLRI